MDIVVLNSYPNYVEAHIAKGVVEEQGIRCWLKDENTVTIDPILTNAIGGIKLLVLKEEAQQAWEILQALKKEKQATVACANCGSHNLEFVSTPRKASNWFTAIATFFISDYAVALDKVYHCFDCGHEFSKKEEDAGS
jgi:DNA-directed RNA polymerase subunit RPC12/RpoP